jgi:hypothetical protein
MMTREEIEEIRRRLDAATPGPWLMSHRHCEALPGSDAIDGLGWDWKIGSPMSEMSRGLRGFVARSADANLIEHFHDDLDSLLLQVGEQNTKLATLQAVVDSAVQSLLWVARYAGIDPSVHVSTDDLRQQLGPSVSGVIERLLNDDAAKKEIFGLVRVFADEVLAQTHIAIAAKQGS